MKKIIAMLLCLLMVLSLVACGAKEEPAADSKAPEAPAAEGPAEDTKAEEPAEESSDAAEGEPYKVGFFAPLSGGNAEYGQQNLNSVQLYAKLLNEKGGWFGRPVEIIPYDDQGDPTTSLAVVTKLIKEDKVDAICGTQQSACLIGCIETIQAAGVPVFTGGTSNSFASAPYIYRTTVSTDYSTEPILRWMSENGYATVGIFYQDDDASVTAADAFAAFAEKYGVEVVAREVCSGEDTDYTGQCVNLVAAEPDGIFFANNGTQMTQFLKQIRDNGYEGYCFNKEAIQMFTIEVAGDATNNVAFAWPCCTFAAVEDAPEGTELRRMLELYYKEYGKMPTSDCAFRGWDAMLMLDAAVNLAGEYTKEAVAQALYDLGPVEGCAGMYDFSEGELCADGIQNIEDLWYIEDGTYYKLVA